jgi:hypothetical protein
LVVYRQAAVHHDRNPSRFEASGHVIVSNSLLHPNQLGTDLQKLLEQRRDMLRAPEDVYDVDGSRRGSRTQVGVDRLAQGDAARRMDGHDCITDPLEICRHAVTRPFGFAAQTDYRYAPGIAHQLG